MEGNLRKRNFSLLWITAAVLVLSIGRFGYADVVDNNTSNIVAGTYGSGLGLDFVPKPDVNSFVDEDMLQFTSSKITIGAQGGETNFIWKTQFGERGTGMPLTMRIVGGTNTFDNQGIYIGSRSGINGVGGDVNVTFDGGDNLFTQRAIFGGEGGKNGASSSLAGRSNVTFNGGKTVFQYEKYGWSDGKYLGENAAFTAGSRVWEGQTYNYTAIDSYNYYRNYYGVFFSAMAEETLPGGGADGGNTQGAELTFNGGTTIFNVETNVGGSYDLTPRCSVNTSSDDDDVVYGGTNLVTMNGGIHTFGARTYFGAGGSDTTVLFKGGMTSFTGEYVSVDMDNGLATAEHWTQNTYRGNDLPYAYFGGKTLTQQDFDYFNKDLKPYDDDDALLGDKTTFEATTKVLFDGGNENQTTVDFGTTAFFGGADERWLAGDQYEYDADGNLVSRFQYRHTDHDGSAIRKDGGRAEVLMTSGKLKLGYVNTTEIVTEREWNGIVHEESGYTGRYEQIRLIGKNASFTATDGRIQFDTRVHQDAVSELSSYTAKDNIDGKYAQAVADGYTGYFTDLDATVVSPTQVTENAQLLEAGMFAFDSINISRNVDLTIGGVGKMVVRAESDEVGHEFYTTPTFVDTTNATYIKDTTVDLSNSTAVGGENQLAIQNPVYNKWAYDLRVEDVDDAYAGTAAIESNQARIHVVTKDFDDIMEDMGNLSDNKETVREILSMSDSEAAGENITSVQNALEQIFSSSKNAEEAAGNFDQLIGATYGDMVANQIRRMTSYNNLFAHQLVASDVCVRNIRNERLGRNDNGCGSCGSCGDCCKHWKTFGGVYGDTGKVGDRHHYSGYDVEAWGANFGVDWNDCEAKHFGAYFNYNQSDVNSEAPMGYTHIESEDYSFGLYGKWLGLVGGGYGLTNFNLTFSNYESDRALYLDDTFDSEYDGIMPTLYYERGWMWYCHEDCWINPYFALQYAYAHTDGFSENGQDLVGNPSDLALNVSDIDHHSLRTFVGLRLNRDFMVGRNCDRRLTLRLNGTWIHEVLGEVDPTFTTSHAANSTYPIWNVRANAGGRDWANVGLGLDFDLGYRWSCYADYDAYVNEYTVIHTGMATLKYEF